MRVAYFMIALFLLLPYAGLYTVSLPILDVYGLSIDSVYALRRAYPVFLACFVLAFLVPLYFGMGSKNPPRQREFTARKLRRLRLGITFFLLFALVLAFVLVGKDILTGQTHRGAVRTSFGGLGFLYKTFMQFWVPAALAISGVLYRNALDSGKRYRFPFLHLVLTLLTLSMMGYKAGIITGILPFLFIVVSHVSLTRQVWLGVIFAAALIYYSAIIMSSQSLASAAQYILIRGTEGTAWGLIATWELFEYPHPGSWLALTPVFGPRITATLLDIPFGSIEYLMLGSGQYVTYLVHPDPTLVLAGETNLTITLAGEAIYLLGHNLFWLLAIPAGFIIGLLCNLLRFAIRRNQAMMAPLMAIIVTNIVLPLLNSGGLVSLISAFNVFYIAATAVFIRLVYSVVLRKPA